MFALIFIGGLVLLFLVAMAVKFYQQSVTEQRVTLEGYKVKLMAGVMFILGLADVVDPNALVQVLGQGAKGYIILSLAVLTYILRNMTDGPAGRVVPKLGPKKY